MIINVQMMINFHDKNSNNFDNISYIKTTLTVVNDSMIAILLR